MDWKRFAKVFFGRHWPEILFFFLAAAFIYDWLHVNSATMVMVPFAMYMLFLLVATMLIIILSQIMETFLGLIFLPKQVGIINEANADRISKNEWFAALFGIAILLLYFYLSYFFIIGFAEYLGILWKNYLVFLGLWFAASLGQTYFKAREQPGIGIERFSIAEHPVTIGVAILLIAIAAYFLVGYLEFLNPENCNEDRCFFQLALTYGDESFCGKIKSVGPNYGELFTSRDECYYTVAIHKHNIKMCSKIVDSTYNEYCKKIIEGKV